jgi:hypothetical protein
MHRLYVGSKRQKGGSEAAVRWQRVAVGSLLSSSWRAFGERLNASRALVLDNSVYP